MSEEPSILTREEIKQLPRWALVAFVARCVRRVLPLFKHSWPQDPWALASRIEEAVSMIEDSARTGIPHENLATELDSVESEATEASHDNDKISAAAYVAEATFYANCTHPENRYCVNAAIQCCKAATKAANIYNVDIKPRIRSDFEKILEIVKTNDLTDETPVAQEIFGPLWPNSKPSGWPKHDEYREFTGATYHQAMGELLEKGFLPLTIGEFIREFVASYRRPEQSQTGKLVKSCLQVPDRRLVKGQFQSGDAVVFYKEKIKIISSAMSYLRKLVRSTDSYRRDYLIDGTQFPNLPGSVMELSFHDACCFSFDNPLARSIWTALVGDRNILYEYRQLLQEKGCSAEMQVWFASYREYETKDTMAVARIWQFNGLPTSDIDAMYYVNDSGNGSMPPVRLIGIRR